jgi:hypothetical protein
MAIGDHIKVRRFGLLYAHHGIDMGDGTVIHFTDRGKSQLSADEEWPRIVRTSLQEFLDGGELLPVAHKPEKSLPTLETCRLAQEALHRPRKYNLVFNNCEHFANYCKTGRAKSSQVWRALSMAAPVAMVILGVLVGKHKGSNS